ncbi:LytTR family transcriptional regulator [Spirosoma sp. BT702]|uniref:LytTR family transcriptional regulator n=1 Tax=Spirosoma profusum TaxID=2771354 RepID=A0A926XYE8_9BACT|nr:LytTR family DNA-binding domain-containing protein [Spirosoma profusum]MBD2700113.1 LytTR family transcriptional regulator [Spirosoma profusum]
MTTPTHSSVRMILYRPRLQVKLQEVLRVEGNNVYCIVHFVDGTALKIAICLSVMAQRLPELVRVHKQHLVNFSYVARIYKRKNSLELTSGVVLPVARRRKSQIQQQFNQFEPHA